MYESHRKEFLKKLRKAKFQLPMQTIILIEKSNLHACKIITKFLQKCHLQIKKKKISKRLKN